jgi:hypothetical protein
MPELVDIGGGWGTTRGAGCQEEDFAVLMEAGYMIPEDRLGDVNWGAAVSPLFGKFIEQAALEPKDPTPLYEKLMRFEDAPDLLRVWWEGLMPGVREWKCPQGGCLRQWSQGQRVFASLGGVGYSLGLEHREEESPVAGGGAASGLLLRARMWMDVANDPLPVGCVRPLPRWLVALDGVLSSLGQAEDQWLGSSVWGWVRLDEEDQETLGGR